MGISLTVGQIVKEMDDLSFVQIFEGSQCWCHNKMFKVVTQDRAKDLFIYMQFLLLRTSRVVTFQRLSITTGGAITHSDTFIKVPFISLLVMKELECRFGD